MAVVKQGALGGPALLSASGSAKNPGLGGLDRDKLA
jgi:hypothetical protein